MTYKDLDGPDHEASLEPNEFAELVKSIRNISIALGSSKKTISKSEMKMFLLLGNHCC